MAAPRRTKPGLDLVIHGWLAKDPEFITTASGKAVSSWLIYYKYRTKSGLELSKAFICKAFDELAEYVASTYRMRDFISCRVHYLSLWEGRDGKILEDYIISGLIEEDKDLSITTGDADDSPPI